MYEYKYTTKFKIEATDLDLFILISLVLLRLCKYFFQYKA